MPLITYLFFSCGIEGKNNRMETGKKEINNKIVNTLNTSFIICTEIKRKKLLEMWKS